MLKVKKKYFAIIALVAILFLSTLYVYRVYKVNHSNILDYAPTKEIHNMNEVIPMPSGFYNQGYVDLSGYYVEVIDSNLFEIDELSNTGVCSSQDVEIISKLGNYDWIAIVTAIFHFEGNSDPLIGVVDLSNFRIVGIDYYINCSTELNELGVFNQILNGNNQFSIASGKEIEIQLPFLVDTESIWAVEPEFIKGSDSYLLLSQYPKELYVELNF